MWSVRQWASAMVSAAVQFLWQNFAPGAVENVCG